MIPDYFIKVAATFFYVGYLPLVPGHPEDVSEIHLADLKIEGYIEKPINLLTVLNTLKYLIGE